MNCEKIALGDGGMLMKDKNDTPEHVKFDKGYKKVIYSLSENKK